MSTITDSIGRVLSGRYLLQAAVGTGASAHVYRARDLTLGRQVAVKVLHPALSGDGGFVRRFRAEAQAAASLAHPNVLAVFDWGEDADGPYLVLEYLAGGSLRALLDSGARLDVAQAVSVGVQAAEGLAYAHGRGFVHRDVKPANLLFGEDGRLRVADFGLARALAEAAWTEPIGATVGTARYASPEAAQGRRVDARSDVYSLALVLYEAVTGVVPFGADTTVGTLMARVGQRLPGHDALGPLAGVLEAAADPEPAGRPDAASLARSLRQLATRLPDPGPLPLAGAGDRGRSEVTDDPTVHGAQAMVPAPDPAMPGVAAGGPPVAAPGATAVRRTGRQRRAHRRLRLAVTVTAAAAALAGGLSAAAATTALFVPSHRVPSVVDLPVGAAKARLRPEHLALRVSGRRSSLTVPAGAVMSQRPRPGSAMKEGGTVEVVLSTGPPPVPVPDLTRLPAGGTCATVAQQLAAAHLSEGSCTEQASAAVPAGAVVDYSPKGSAPEGAAVDVVLSSGPPVVAIPDLSGITTCAGVDNALKAAGFQPACSTSYETGVPAGAVVSVSPSGSAPEGATVTVVLSKGPPPVTVPAIPPGTSVSQAIATIQGAGLVVGNIYGPGGGRVVFTNPAGGQQVPAGSTVNIYTE